MYKTWYVLANLLLCFSLWDPTANFTVEKKCRIQCFKKFQIILLNKKWCVSWGLTRSLGTIPFVSGSFVNVAWKGSFRGIPRRLIQIQNSLKIQFGAESELNCEKNSRFKNYVMSRSNNSTWFRRNCLNWPPLSWKHLLLSPFCLVILAWSSSCQGTEGVNCALQWKTGKLLLCAGRNVGCTPFVLKMLTPPSLDEAFFVFQLSVGLWKGSIFWKNIVFGGHCFNL